MTSAGLTADNTTNFWNDMWKRNQTGWREFERDGPFERNLAEALAALHRDPNVTVSLLQGRNAFVPLCGDSAVVRYLHDGGCARVVGVDISTQAIAENIVNRFGGYPFQTITSSSTAAEGQPARTVHSATVAPSNAFAWPRTVELIDGDIFTTPESVPAGSIDIVYDRAAMVAMPPSLTVAYLELIRSLLKPKTGVLFLERVVRGPATHGQGPPFDVAVDIIQSVFPSSLYAMYDLDPHVTEEAAAAKTTQPPFLFRRYVIVEKENASTNNS